MRGPAEGRCRSDNASSPPRSTRVQHAFDAPGTLPPQPNVLIDITCTGDAKLVESSSSPHPLVVGEWSVGMPQWLLTEARVSYPFSPGWRSFLRSWFIAQMQTYNAWAFDPARRVKGAMFWAFKTETPDAWTASWALLPGIRDGYIPSNVPGAVANGERVC